MSINLTVPNDTMPHLKPKLTVIGVGGAGGNAVNNMIRAQLEGVEFVVANTDAQSLSQSGTDRRIQLGARLTEGLGAGSRPEVGRGAAEESIDEILAELEGVHMAFIAAGMGGGTGTGGAPVIARAAKEKGILTVGVVTKPFQFEGSHRMKQAEAGIEDLEKYVDTLIVIPNQNLFRIANEKTTFADAFAMADEVLYSGVRGVTDLMVMPGLINLDFADIRSVMSEMGKAMMGTGEAAGERRALDAAEAAIANPLLDDTSMKGAKGVLINITGGMDITLFEVDEAANRIRAEVEDEAYIIVGSAFDSDLEGTMRVSVVATGIDINAAQMALPTMLHLADQLDAPEMSRRHAEPEPEPVLETIMEPAPEPQAETMPEPMPGAAPVMEADAAPEMEAVATAPDEAIAESAPEIEPEAIGESETESAQESGMEPVLEDSPEAQEPEQPPAAMPSVGATDAFIPPEPARPAETAAKKEMAGETGQKEAYASLEAPEEAPQPVASPWRSKGVSLFERVTGSGKAAFGRKDPVSKPVEIKEVSFSEETPAPEPAATPVSEQMATVTPLNSDQNESDATQSDGGTDAQERLPASDNTDDLLDIPAFLRRQAN